MRLQAVIISLLVFSTTAMAQTTGTDNTLNTTGITGIQSTTATGYKLSVGGAVKLFNYGNNGVNSPSLYLSNLSSSTGGKNYYINSDENGFFRIVDSNANAVRFLISDAGNIGIGTTSPGAKLDVTGNISVNTQIVNPLNTNKINFRYDGNNGIGFHLTDGNAIQMAAVAGNNYIQAIGGSSPFHISTWPAKPIKLEVGSIRAMVVHANGRISIGSETDNGFGQLQITGDTWISGNTGIGTSAPAAKLDVAGNFKLVDGTQGAGKVLTSDADGLTSWQTPSGGGGSQWTTTGNDIYSSNSGNVGIGTGSPTAKLEVSTTGSTGFIINAPGGSTGLLLQPTGVSDPYSPLIKFKETMTNSIAIIGMDYGGDLRLAAPSNKMVLFGTLYSALSNVNINTYVYGVLAAPNNYVMKIRNPDATAVGLMIKGSASQAANLQEWQNDAGDPLSVVDKDGNIGIGVTSIPATYKMAVKGNIIAEKVRVKLHSAGWPDYVFHPGYDLPTLAATEEFIKKNNHLSGVPSAAEIEKEGLDLGDGQAVLLKKIEELTLHMIEMNKRLERLETENEIMKKKINKER